MNRQTFIDTLRCALYGRVSDYELADHIRYYEDYIQQEIMKGRSEQEVLGELGDPRLIARTILETSGLETPNVEYTIDEDGREDSGYTSSDGQIKVHAFTGWKAGLVMALIAVVIIAIIVMALGLFIYLLPVLLIFLAISWFVKKFLR